MTLVALGRTDHFEIEYDDSLELAEGRLAANGLLETCEGDYALMSTWFDGAEPAARPISIKLIGEESSKPLTQQIELAPGPAATSPRVRYLFVMEVSKLFMLSHERGWLTPLGAGPGSSLSPFLGAMALAAHGLGSPDCDFQHANDWMGSERADYVNFSDDSPEAVGCGVLFLYYLLVQQGFTVNQIVGAGAPDLGGVYRNLTGDLVDPFVVFKSLLETRYPGATTIPDDHPDNPWPIGHLAGDVLAERVQPITPWAQGITSI